MKALRQAVERQELRVEASLFFGLAWMAPLCASVAEELSSFVIRSVVSTDRDIYDRDRRR